MTFDAQMRIGTVEIAAALLAVAVVAARPRMPSSRELAMPMRVSLRIISFGGEQSYEGICPLVIGRSHEADVVLADPEASRRHARLECRDGVVFVRDLESSNGTFLNERRVREAIEIRNGDEIDVGNTRLMVENIAFDPRAGSQRWT